MWYIPTVERNSSIKWDTNNTWYKEALRICKQSRQTHGDSVYLFISVGPGKWKWEDGSRHWFSTFLCWALNSSSCNVGTPNLKVTLFILHNCSFATVMSDSDGLRQPRERAAVPKGWWPTGWELLRTPGGTKQELHSNAFLTVGLWEHSKSKP